ncbi:DUF4157 domain-containing protein [Actinoplanes sp. NPDC051633]|uniref:eCIS core domain-containing protein n=1 Tax=Actinoplanes sp. NPDC051633 TaxID=3155670 RepID=UPI00342F48DB
MTQAHAVAAPEKAPPRAAPSTAPAHSPAPSAGFAAHAHGHELDRVTLQRALSGPGYPVDAAQRASAERATGQDLSHVRLHTGPAVRVAARAAEASAFTLSGDVAIAVGPDQVVPDRLLTHELVHAAQQGAAGGATPEQAELQARAVDSGGDGADLLGTGGVYVAFAATDWLQSSPDVRGYGYTALLDELNEVDEWLGRQISSSPDVDRMQEAKAALEAEVRRRQGAMAAQDRPRRRGRRAGTTGRPQAEAELPAQTEMPRILREQTSEQLTDPAEMRAEVDRITAWLQRPDLTRADRSILRRELMTLAPGLSADLAQASGERRQARLAQALAPSGSNDRAGVLANLRMIESIRPYQEQPGMAYVVHNGEMLVFPQQLADRVRAEAVAALRDAARHARDMNESSQFRMSEHMRLNYEEQPYVGFVVSLVSGEEPVEVQSRMLGPLSDSNIALNRFGRATAAGSLSEMGDAVFTAVEKADQAQDIVLRGIDRAIAAAGTVVQGLTITRNLAFAIALSIGAILAAPVVAAGVAGLGVTGLAATGLTALGTSGVVGAGGFGLGFVSGAGGELASGGGGGRALSAGWSEGLRVGGQGAAIGLGGGATLGLARNLGVGAEGLSTAQNLWRGALAQGAGGGLGGAAGGVLSAPEGMRGEAVLRGGLTGFGLGAFGGTAGAYARTLGSPSAQYAVGVGLPSVGAGGVTYLQTGDWSQAIQAGGTGLTVGALGQLRAGQGRTAGEERAFQTGVSTRQTLGSWGRTGRAFVAATGLGLYSSSTALRLGESGTSYTLSNPQESGYVGAPTSIQQAPVQQAPVATTAAPTSVSAATQLASIRISSGAFLVNPARLVTDPFSGQVLGQRSASAQTSRSVITGPRADGAEAAGWREALARGEIGLQAPTGANVPGGDFYTARIDPNGQVTLIANDVKMSTIGQFPTPATTLRPTWRAELLAAIQPGRLNLGDPALEAAIRAAFAAGRIQLRQLNADYSPGGGGTITGF